MKTGTTKNRRSVFIWPCGNLALWTFASGQAPLAAWMNEGSPGVAGNGGILRGSGGKDRPEGEFDGQFAPGRLGGRFRGLVCFTGEGSGGVS